MDWQTLIDDDLRARRERFEQRRQRALTDARTDQLLAAHRARYAQQQVAARQVAALLRNVQAEQ